MKARTLATKVMIAILCLGVIAYLAASFIRDWEEPLVITRAYSYTQNVGMEAVGILVRSETVLPDSGGSYVDHILSEGEATIGGIRTNDRLTALDADNKPIGGLFIGGLNMGSAFCRPYYDIPGTACGLSIASGVTGAKEIIQYLEA